MNYLAAVLLFISANCFGQTGVQDTVPAFERTAGKYFHLAPAVGANTVPAFERAAGILRSNPNFNFDGEAVSLIIEMRHPVTNESIFYYMLSLIVFLALTRLIFYKYISTLFTLFFRATLRQQQLREQLLQFPLPALLLNIFFVVNIGTYFVFLAKYYKLPFAENFWTSMFYVISVVAIIYAGKYLLLTIAGWVFGIRSVSESYLFIVFLINKMTGIFLLPILVLMAFPNPALLPVVITLSYVLLGGMIVYRFIISYKPVRDEIKLNRLHFFLYLCAFEIAPLLLIYKVLLARMDSGF